MPPQGWAKNGARSIQVMGVVAAKNQVVADLECPDLYKEQFEAIRSIHESMKKTVINADKIMGRIIDAATT